MSFKKFKKLYLGLIFFSFSCTSFSAAYQNNKCDSPENWKLSPALPGLQGIAASCNNGHYGCNMQPHTIRPCPEGKHCILLTTQSQFIKFYPTKHSFKKFKQIPDLFRYTCAGAYTNACGGIKKQPNC